MRTGTLNSASYSPNPIPLGDLRTYVFDEFARISAAINALAAGHLDVVHVEPTKPREGDIRFADGTNWDPGSGKGIYYYNGSSWALLG